MTTELFALIVAHFACSDMAEERPLSGAEVQYCGAVYHEVKLGFLPEVDARSYLGLSPREQAEVNRAGFTAFYAWRARHPEVVRHLESVARGERALQPMRQG